MAAASCGSTTYWSTAAIMTFRRIRIGKACKTAVSTRRRSCGRGLILDSAPRNSPRASSRANWEASCFAAIVGGRGQITVTLDDQKGELPLAEGHKSAATRFDRFGIISTWIDGNSQTIYFDDLTYTAKQD